jgi:23S rRNA pseudouridine1911/1915/1917 synthase
MNEKASAHSFHVTPEDAGQRLDAFLVKKFPDISRARLQKLIDNNSVAVNNQPQKKRFFVRQDDTVSIILDEIKPGGTPPIGENIPIDIIYEDKYLLAVNKPAGMIVHPGHGNQTGTLVNALVYHGGLLASGFSNDRPGIVHRLDKETTGLLLVAKNDQIHAKLAALFAERKVDKQYIGFGIGRRPPEHDIIDQALGRNTNNPTKRSVRADGKPAQTEYWLLGHQKGISLLRFKLHTGRTHQIRVHCAHTGMPILHDEEYGGGESALMRIPPLDRPFTFKMYKCFDRQALHAWKIELVHPVTKKKLKLEAPIPVDIKNALSVAGWDDLI